LTAESLRRKSCGEIESKRDTCLMYTGIFGIE
jgi:hypothetical protein